MRQSLDDPTAYPRVYRLRRRVAALWMFTGIVGIGWGGFSAVNFATDPSMATENLRILFVSVGISFILFGVFCIISVFQYRFVLDYDKIQISSFLCRREMRRDSIAGLLRSRNEVSEFITLVPNDPRAKRLRFADHMQPDEFFVRWLASMRDLRTGPWGRARR